MSISNKAKRRVLNGLCGENEKHAEGAGAEAFRLQLHTGIPGAAGLENVLPECPRRAFLVPFLASDEAAAAGRANSNVIEFAELLNGGTIEYVSLWNNFEEFLGYAKLAENVTVAKGDTFKVNVGDLKITAE